MAGKLSKFFGKTTKNNPIEAVVNVGGIASGVVDSIQKDVLQASATDMWKQILGNPEQPSKKAPAQGELKPGQELVLNGKKKDLATGKPEKTPEKRLNIAAAYDYRSEIIHSEKLSRRESAEVTQKVQEIMVELKRLVDSSTVLSAEFASVSIEQKPVNVGKYHLHFFEWMLLMIKSARMKVEDSGAWLKVMGSKKKQRQYGSMAKKHGTSFTLSNERVVATQTG